MAYLIDKDALVAEIEKLHKEHTSKEYRDEAALVLEELEDSLDTFEVKEINFDKEYEEYVEEDPVYNMLVNGIVGKAIAKHFFELGMQACNPLTWEDVKEICVQSVLVEIDLGGKVSDERHYTEVLKRFKALKGE